MESKRPPLRVALDTSYAGVNPTGVGLYSARLASELKRQAFDLDLDLLCYGPACQPSGPKSTILGTFQEWPTYTQGILPMQLLATRPQIVHATSHVGPLWGAGKLIVTVHDLIFLRYPEDYNPGWLALARMLLPRVLRRATAIIADSHATKSDIQALCGVRKGKIAVVYPGMDAPTLQSHNAHMQGEPYLLCLGPWVQRKNIPVVMQAFARIAPMLPNLHLVLTGDRPRGMKGYTSDELLGHVPSEYKQRVHTMGYVSHAEKCRLLANASALCYPSRYEGFGLPPLEAMAAGVPVVAADTPAVSEVTAGAALLCDPDNPQQWADALIRVVTSEEETGRLREKGKRRSAQFTWERCAQETARLYHAVARR